MSLKDEGFRFCASHDRREARWVHPAEMCWLQGGWIDLTDLTEEQFEAYFAAAPAREVEVA